MRNAIWTLISLVITGLALVFLLPVLGVLLMVIVGLVVLAIVAFMAAPWLSKLPWFRNRIHVDRTPFGRTIRFGGANAYRTWQEQPGEPKSGARLDQGDVIDIEGRELPDRPDQSDGTREP